MDGVKFAGSGSADISNEMPKALPTESMSKGGPVEGGPDTNEGMIAPTGIKQTDGAMPSGSGTVQFTGDVDK